MNFLRQATASQARAIGPFLDDTDGKTAETALTIANTDVKLLVNGGASANKNSGGGTHRANGVYGVTFDATDTATVGEMEVSVSVSGALPVFKTFFVLEEAVYDALFAASANAFAGAAGSSTVTFSNTSIATVTNLTNAPTAGDLTATMKASVNTEADTALSDYGALKPTVAGHTLDVSTGGEAGIDLANVGSSTTTLNLSGVTVKAVTDGVTVASIASDAVNAAAIATDAGAELAAAVWAAGTRTLTDKTGFSLANGSFVTATFGTCDLTSTMKTSVTTAATAATPTAAAVTGNVGGNVVGSVGSISGVTFPANFDALVIYGSGGVDVSSILGGILAQTASGRLASSFSTVFNVATASFTAASVNQTGDSFARIGATGSGLTSLASATTAAAIAAKTGNLPASPAATGDAMTLTSGERSSVAAALLDLADGVETDITVRKALRAIASGLAGDVTGAGTGSEAYKAIGNSGTTRVSPNADASGNRTNVTLNL